MSYTGASVDFCGASFDLASFRDVMDGWLYIELGNICPIRGGYRKEYMDKTIFDFIYGERDPEMGWPKMTDTPEKLIISVQCEQGVQEIIYYVSDVAEYEHNFPDGVKFILGVIPQRKETKFKTYDVYRAEQDDLHKKRQKKTKTVDMKNAQGDYHWVENPEPETVTIIQNLDICKKAK